MGVLNAGIGGNRVLNEAAVPAGVDTRAVGAGINALARFERHVLSLPGVTHVIVLEGINDIGNARQNPTPTAEDLIAAHKQLIEQAHARGLKIIGATLTPFWGAAYYTEAGEAKRQALNEWIRTGKAYDGVVDFDKATRDPADPKKLLEKYDSCDYLHPSDAGLQGDGRRDRSVALQDRSGRRRRHDSQSDGGEESLASAISAKAPCAQGPCRIRSERLKHSERRQRRRDANMVHAFLTMRSPRVCGSGLAASPFSITSRRLRGSSTNSACSSQPGSEKTETSRRVVRQKSVAGPCPCVRTSRIPRKTRETILPSIHASARRPPRRPYRSRQERVRPSFDSP